MLKTIEVNINDIAVYFNMFVPDMNENVIEELLKNLVNEVKALRRHMEKKQLETCSPYEALMIIGITNRRLLKYFLDLGLLNRRKGGTSFVYYKEECKALALMIRDKKVMVPTQRDLYN